MVKSEIFEPKSLLFSTSNNHIPILMDDSAKNQIMKCNVVKISNLALCRQLPVSRGVTWYFHKEIIQLLQI